MKNKVLVSAKEEGILKTLISNNIYFSNYTIKYNKVIFIINYEDLELLSKLANIKVIKYYGLVGIKNFLKKHYILLTSFILSYLIIIILSNVIFKVEIVTNNQVLKDNITYYLNYYGIVKYKFVKSNKYIENVKEKILLENKDTIEWISINREGVKYVVNVTPRVISNKVNIDKPSNIVSKKDALIKYLVVTGGSSVKEVNDVVKKGDVIISGNVVKFDKVVGTTRSKGKVFGEVWYTVNISIPFKHVIYEKTGETINHIYLDIFGHKFTLVGHYITNNSINEVSVLVDKPYLFFKLMKESKELYNYKEVNLNSESAFKEALERADKSISNKLDTNEYIIERKVLKKDVFSSKIDIELFYRVYENIGEEKEITLESE